MCCEYCSPKETPAPPKPVEYFCRTHDTWAAAQQVTGQNFISSGDMVATVTVLHDCGIMEEASRTVVPLFVDVDEVGTEFIASNQPKYWQFVPSREVEDD